jgi:hypothetical protein
MLDTKAKRKQTLLVTKAKRRQQVCEVIELKIAEDHLNKKEKEQLRMMFLEAKWLYNYILSLKDPFHYDYKTNPIQRMNKNKKQETITLKYLPPKNRQTLSQIVLQNIKTLSASKKKGNKVGELKFKSKYRSIDLNQYGATHFIRNNKFKINGIKRLVKVYGLDQIKPEYEFANAKLIKDPNGYFIKLTCYYFPKGEVKQSVKKNDIGIDFGCKTAFTTSEGEKILAFIEEPERLKKIQRDIFKSVKGSNNRYKLMLLLQKEYKHLDCKKDDIANKIVHDLRTRYGRIFIQDENLRGWKAGGHGKKIQHSVLGRVKSRLSRLKQTTMIDRWKKSTKLCYICGAENDIGYDPIYRCQCGLIEDRDIKAAKTILKLGYIDLDLVPMESREFKPVENLTSANFVSKSNSVKQETGLLISQ